MREVLVSDLMTAEELVTLHRSESLPSAAELMKLARIRHLPVVDDHHRLVGLVTHRDVLAAQVGATSPLDDHERSELQLGVRVERIMRRQVWTVRPEQPALDAARLLHDLDFGCVPVVDGERKLVGLVTEADFLGLAGRVLDGDLDRQIREMMTIGVVALAPDDELSMADLLMKLEHIRHLPVIDDGGALVGLLTHRDLLRVRRSTLSEAQPYPSSVTARDLMKTEVDTVTPSTSALAAVRRMIDRKYGCLPVVDDGRVAGIVTESDFLRAVILALMPRRNPPRHDAPVNYYMTEHVVLVNEDDSLESVERTLEEHRVSGTAVVDDRGVMVGAISRSDLVRARLPGVDHGTVRDLLRLPPEPVTRVASKALVTTRPEVAIAEAAAAMLARGVHRLFVVDGERRPIGVVSVTDLALAVRDFELAGPVASYSTSPIFTVDANEPLTRALELFDLAGLHGVVVRDHVWPVGYLSNEEVLRARELPDHTPVQFAMSQRLITVSADVPIHRVAGQVAALRARRVVVLSEGHVAGVLTGMDFARILAAAR